MKRFPVFLLPFFLLACSSSKESRNAGGSQGTTPDVRIYESDFRPSDYDSDPAGAPVEAGEHSVPDADRTADTPVLTSTEQVSGFRVQFFSTTNIDDAKRKKEEAEAAYPSELFYSEYDPPTYKLRAGNFLTRFEAERFAKVLSEKGFPDAWAVPTRVFKQLPPGAREPSANPK